MARFLRTLQSTRRIFLIRNQGTFLPDVMRISRTWIRFFATINTNTQFDGFTGARQTNFRLLPGSRRLNEDQQQRWHWNSHLYYLHQPRARSSSPHHVVPLRNSCLKYSTSSGFVPTRLSDEGNVSDSDDAGNNAQLLESKLNLEDKSMIDSLIEHRARYGDCHIPTGNAKNAKEEREKLGVPGEVADWVVKQRRKYQRSNNKKGKISDSLAAKITMLESIGFMWSCREAQWQCFFNKLEQSYRSHEEGNLFTINQQDNPQLYTWVEQQRKTYKKGTMPVEREMLLREIDFLFDPIATRWRENYRNLCRYYEEHGNTMVPLLLDDDENPNYLGQWVARQRRFYRTGSIRDDRITALNDLDFSWDPEAESWENNYNQLCDFHREHNHTRVPKGMGSLWNWVDRQRRSYRKRLRLRDANENDETIETEVTLITNENVQKLSTLGFEWENPSQRGEAENRIKRLMNVTFELSIHDENWAKHYDKLCSFHKQIKHFSIPTGSGEYKELNTWVRHTRYLYNSNKLPKNRVELLESIGFAWTAEAAKWDRLCEEFLSFHKQYGHSDVPMKNTELYRWAEQQKENDEYFDECQLVGTKAKTERRKRLHTLKEIFL
jgi:hypothetical protein